MYKAERERQNPSESKKKKEAYPLEQNPRLIDFQSPREGASMASH